MGLPYVCLARDDISAVGNTIVAGYAIGLYADMFKATEQFVKPAERYEPNMKVHEEYKQYITIYRDFLARSEATFNDLAKLNI